MMARRRIAFGASLLALVIATSRSAPAARTPEAVADMLGRAVGGQVRSDDYVWQRSRGFWLETIFGRDVWFLADSNVDEGPARDLYRARVRLSRGGRALSVHGVENITRTPLGDEGDLEARGHRIAFATSFGGFIQAVTVLDLDAKQTGGGAIRRVATAFASWMQGGIGRRLARYDLIFGILPHRVRFELIDDALVLALGPESEPAAYYFSTDSFNGGPKDPYRGRVQVALPASQSIAESASSGAAAIFGALGRSGDGAIRRAVAGAKRALSRSRPVASPETPVVEASPDEGATPPFWPPAIDAPAMAPGGAPAGWHAPPADVSIPRVEGSDRPYLAHTALVPLSDRPDEVVHLVTADARVLNLRWEAGSAWPRSVIGPNGPGRISSPAKDEPIVAAFNGAFGGSFEPVASGAVLEGRVLVPPSKGAPSIVLDQHAAAFGSFPFADGALPASVRSIVQADAIIHEGRATPWASSNDGTTGRSAICATSSGHFVYAWGDAVSPAALAGALAAVDCVEGLRLAGAPAPLGFACIEVPSEGPARGASLVPGMTFDADRLWAGASHDFFTLRLTDSKPRFDGPGASQTHRDARESPDGRGARLVEGGEWDPDKGQQPRPAWIPAVYEASVVELGAQVRLVWMAVDRFSFRMRAGRREPERRGAEEMPERLPEIDRGRALVAIGLGVGRRKSPRGFVLEGSLKHTFRGELGALVVDRAGASLAIEPSVGSISLTEAGDVTELPLTADDGKLRPEAREVGTMRARSAACLRGGGLVVATTTFDSDEATTQALLDIGCSRIVALDRGSHHASFVHRKGTADDVQDGYDVSVLYAIETPMRGRVRSKIE